MRIFMNRSGQLSALLDVFNPRRGRAGISYAERRQHETSHKNEFSYHASLGTQAPPNFTETSQ